MVPIIQNEPFCPIVDTFNTNIVINDRQQQPYISMTIGLPTVL